MNSITNLTPGQLRQAANIQEKIQSLQKELGQLLGSPAPAFAATKAPKKKGKMSAAGLANIRAAQRARWAKIKAAKAPKKKRTFSAKAIANIRAGVAKRMAARGKAVQKPRKKLTAAGRAALSAAAKARWAKAKKAGKSKL